jgi:hypothetical protein
MSIRINLKIKTVPDPEAIEQNIELPLIRLKAQIKFWAGSSWTRSFDGIIDTGCPILPAKLATVSCTLLDTINTSPPIDIRCYLLQTNDVPLVIGILDILTYSKLFFDYKNNIAYLEF